jgi:site-specific DNA-methyltransferase (adenine-specific)
MRIVLATNRRVPTQLSLGDDISAVTRPAGPLRDGQTTFRLIHGDCLIQLREMDPESIDVVVTSPPYNLGIKYRQYDDTKAREDYLRWTVAWCREVKRVLKGDGSFFLNVGASPSNPLFPHEVVLALRDEFVLQNTFHWIKSVTVETRAGEQISTGHFKPINSERFVTDCHEYVFHLTKTGNVTIDRLAVGVAYADKSNIERWSHTGGRDKRCRGNNWFVPYQTIRSRDSQRPHPATFPVQLAEWCIRLHGRNAELSVLDPFLGIGNAAAAASACAVQSFTGIEIDEQYLGVAIDRVTALQGVPP